MFTSMYNLRLNASLLFPAKEIKRSLRRILYVETKSHSAYIDRTCIENPCMKLCYLNCFSFRHNSVSVKASYCDILVCKCSELWSKEKCELDWRFIDGSQSQTRNSVGVLWWRKVVLRVVVVLVREEGWLLRVWYNNLVQYPLPYCSVWLWRLQYLLNFLGGQPQYTNFVLEVSLWCLLLFLPVSIHEVLLSRKWVYSAGESSSYLWM